ncbi:SGNH/GDSL hydrolase family protein [Bacillus sinesaloumensis]|uniref:SGNH/GDSL hydrolase family protein n=1 Tax=Litchfieldia sinesaloumensis TaxID=1926280 RepID=UPI0009886FC5|nr:GDSL-type esterase/lipase family protein [Bacillus sinesaloumensis]
MKVVCFGDSLTRGVSFVKGRMRILKENYPAFLQQIAPEQVTVLNKGVFNDNSDLLLSRVEKDVIAEQPDFVIINIGGNDCNFKWNEVAEKPEDEHQPIVPIERYMENLKQLIHRIKEANITPVLMTLPPLDPVRYYRLLAQNYGSSISHWISLQGGIEHWHGLYNRSLNLLAEQLHVPKIDVRAAMMQLGDVTDFISDDGIHLTGKGYKTMSSEIFSTFKQYNTN